MSPIRATRFLCIATAALLLLGAIWYALYIFNIIAPAGPPYDEAVSRVENLQVIFAHQRSVLFIVVICQALEIWAVYDVALSLSGAVLAPAWFLMTSNELSKRKIFDL